jgi:hypothetical protein
MLSFSLACSKDNNLPQSSNQAIGLIEMDLWDPPLASVYIDPGNSVSTGRNGSLENPFSSFDEVDWKDNTVYALKRGTELSGNGIVIQANNITIASYGEGEERPIFSYDGTDYALSTWYEGSNNITIRDISIIANNAKSGIIVRSNSSEVEVINCSLKGSGWGLRAINNIEGILIHNTEISDILDDGIYIDKATNIEISNCYIHRVNQNWKPPSTPESEASGDGIQLYLCDDFYVHNNLIDRSDNQNKFCIISSNPDQSKGIIEFNSFSGPQSNGACVYLAGGAGIFVRYNYFYGPADYSIFSHSDNTFIHYNVFLDIKGPAYFSKYAELYNNLFYKCSAGVEGAEAIVKNNIFDLSEESSSSAKVNSLTESNNLVAKGIKLPNSLSGESGFVDTENLDFHLINSSICIDAGIEVNIKLDIDGNTVPSGNAPDIGPYEYSK